MILPGTPSWYLKVEAVLAEYAGGYEIRSGAPTHPEGVLILFENAEADTIKLLDTMLALAELSDCSSNVGASGPEGLPFWVCPTQDDGGTV